MSAPTTRPVVEVHRAMPDAEYLDVYRWVAPLAVGRSVLDVAGGSGEGAALLAEAGARKVVRVTLDAPAGAPLEAMPAGIAQGPGEPGRLAGVQDSYQLVVAIGVPGTRLDDTLLDRLFRVTAPDGLLLVTVPDGRPCEELRERLGRRFGQVTAARRRTFFGSGIAPRVQGCDGRDLTFRTQVVTQRGGPAAGDVFLLAGPPGGHGSSPVLVLEELPAVWRRIESWKARREAVRALEDRVRELEQRLAERDDLRARFRSAQEVLGIRTATQEEAVQEAVAEVASMFEATLGWRLTAPLRRAGAIAGRRRRRG